MHRIQYNMIKPQVLNWLKYMHFNKFRIAASNDGTEMWIGSDSVDPRWIYFEKHEYITLKNIIDKYVANPLNIINTLDHFREKWVYKMWNRDILDEKSKL